MTRYLKAGTLLLTVGTTAAALWAADTLPPPPALPVPALPMPAPILAWPGLPPEHVIKIEIGSERGPPDEPESLPPEPPQPIIGDPQAGTPPPAPVLPAIG